MTLYLGLGKKILGAFVVIASLFSQSPITQTSTKEIPATSSQITVPTPKETLPATSSEFKEALPTKPGYIPVYFNYPEKINIAAKKKVDYNFEKVFLYSLSGDSSKTPAHANTPSNINTQTNNVDTTPILTPKITPPVIPIQTILPPIVVNGAIEQASPRNTDKAIVNIYCTLQNGRTIQAITGSGVIISPEGLVITNAHVGEYPLIAEKIPSEQLSCTARTGSPVDQKYGVKVIYISKNWIEQNPGNISDPSFTENGSNDVALLKLVPGGKGFSNLSYISLSSSKNPQIGNSIIVSSYPADILGTLGISALLRVQTETLSILDAFSFTGNTNIDLLESGDSLHVQHGSSGGAIINTSGQLEGIIATIVGGNSPFAKHVRAITLNHIDSVIRNDMGLSLETIVANGSRDSMGQLSSSELTRSAQTLVSGSSIQQ